MANHDRSREAALKFMDYLATKGLLAPATARSRKAALGKVLSVLDDDEANDVTSIDLDHTMTRFSNLEGQAYTPQSLQTYKSRAKSSLEDFESYLDNPLGFRPNISKRNITRTAAKNEGEKAHKAEEMASSSPSIRPKEPSDYVNPSILPIPIRSDVTVRIQGLPYDLSPQEAAKIAAVVKAMALHEE